MGDTSDDMSSLQAGLKENEGLAKDNIMEVTMQMMFTRDQQQGVERLGDNCWKIK